MRELYPQAKEPDFLFDQRDPDPLTQWVSRTSTKLLMVGGLMTSLALGGNIANAENPEPETTVTQPQPTPDYPLDMALPSRTDFENGYMPTDPITDRFVDAKLAQAPSLLFDKYGDQERDKVRKEHLSDYLLTHDLRWQNENNENIFYKVNKSLADKYNLTVHDPRTAQKAIRNLDTQPNSFNEYFVVASTYLKKFNVDLKIAQPSDKETLGDEVMTPEPSMLEGSNTKRGLSNLVEAFSSLPQEFVNLSMGDGQKTIYLSQNAPVKPDPNHPKKSVETYAGLAYVGGEHNMLTFNVATGFNISVVNHELSHLADDAMMGDGTDDDILYAAKNKGVSYRDDGKNKPYIQSAYDAAYNKAFMGVYALRTTQNFSEACRVAEVGAQELRAQGKKVIFMSEYAGSKNVTEDKAVVGAAVLDDAYNFGLITSEQTPTLRSKAILWLKRIAHYRPSVAGFIIESRNRGFGERTPLTQDCDKPVPVSSYK